jgi:PAS domain-containing protein
MANRRFIENFALSDSWLSEHPLFEELLDAMRAKGSISEQRDFAAWKRTKLKLFENPQERSQRTWHLPNGRSQRVTFCPNALGGLAMVVEDLTSEVELKTAYNALVKVQQVTLDTIEEAIAVFGLDGRLKLHNTAFSRLWPVSEGALARGPHIREISEICAEQIGPDETWNIVTAAVNAAGPERCLDWNTIKRADGHTLSLALTRLPDGGTMVSFSDLTDYLRFGATFQPDLDTAA